MKTKLHISATAVAAVAAAGVMMSPLLAAGETDAQLQTQAKITKSDAQTTALAKVPNGTVKAAELEKEHGKLIWSFDIAMPHSKNITEVQVDAKTGKIVSVQVETPQDQAKEAAADQKNKP
ncbi:MAG TPA: PepSY domain-containing protein [Candidatus Udaeobacter sp.]|nr:PepSY domain-containing protein [Candidatus Udaeobacter sp.]